MAAIGHNLADEFPSSISFLTTFVSVLSFEKFITPQVGSYLIDHLATNIDFARIGRDFLLNSTEIIARREQERKANEEQEWKLEAPLGNEMYTWLRCGVQRNLFPDGIISNLWFWNLKMVARNEIREHTTWATRFN